MKPTIIVFLFLIMTACERQQELCFNHEQHDRIPIDVVFDWGLVPDADPISMSLYLFPDNGSVSSLYEFSGRNGGRILVPPGRYTALAINSDTQGTKVHNSDFLETFELRLTDAYDIQGLNVRSDVLPRAPGTETERMVNSPDAIWRAKVDCIEVKPSIVTQTLTLTMSEAVFHYSAEIRNVENLSGVQSLSASISGMTGSMFIADGSVSDEMVTIPFEMTASDKTTLRGEWISFGHCGHSRSRSEQPKTSGHHLLTVYAVLRDGTQWYHSYDITERLHELPDNESLVTVDEGLHLPEASSTAAGGFNITIDDWQTIPIDIPM